MTVSTTMPEKLSLEQRAEVLQSAILGYTRQGWRVQSQSQTQAQLVKGHRTNHILHLILTILTLGIWAIVWILMALLGGEKHKLIAVNEYGQF